MPLNCALRSAGVGHKIRLDRPVFRVDREISETPLQSEIKIGRYLVREALIKEKSPSLLMVVSSLPRVHRALLASTLVKAEQVSAAGILEIGGHCGAVIDAMHYMFCAIVEDEYCLMIVLDSFMSSYQATSSSNEWLDGGASILVNPDGLYELELRSYAYAFDSDFLSSAHNEGNEVSVPLVISSCDRFAECDEKAIRNVMDLAVTRSGIQVSELSAVVTINRSQEATDRLERIVGNIPIYQSRSLNSHSGGSDMIANLISAFDSHRDGLICILGFGLGYSWQAMIVKISRRSESN